MVHEIENFLNRVLKFSDYDGLIQSYFQLAKLYEIVLNSFEEPWKMDGLSSEESNNILNTIKRISIT